MHQPWYLLAVSLYSWSADQGQQGEPEASQPGQHLQETLAGTAYQQGSVDSAGELERHDPMRLSRPQQEVEHTQDEAHTPAGMHSSSVNPAAQSLLALGPSSSYSSSHDGTFYRQGQTQQHPPHLIFAAVHGQAAAWKCVSEHSSTAYPGTCLCCQ